MVNLRVVITGMDFLGDVGSLKYPAINIMVYLGVHSLT